MPARRQSSFVPLSSFARFRRRAYIFAVTALAVFLWGFAVSRAIPERFTATATIHLGPAEKSGANADSSVIAVAAALRRDLTSEEHVSEALQAVGVINPIGTGINELNSDHLTQVVDVRRNLQVTPLGGGHEEVQVAVSYTNLNAARAALVVNQLVGDYASRVGGNGQQPESPSYDRAHDAVENARQKAKTARAALSRFMARQRDKKQLAPAAVETPAQTVMQAPPEADATLANLTKQLHDLTAKREELLTKLTEAHPEVKQVEWQIGELQKQIDEMPAAAEMPAATPSAVTHTASTPAAAPSWLSPDEADEYSRLAKAVDEAQEQLDVTLKQERAAWDEQVRAASAAGPTVIFTSEPTQPNSTLRELVLVGSAVLAIAAGLAMAAFAAGIRPMFVSVAQAQAALPVPIVGAITNAERHPAAARGGFVPLPLRFVTFLCEASLALFLIAAVSLSLADKQFGSRLIHDPAGALSDAIGRFIS